MPAGSERIQHLEGKPASLHSIEWSGDKLSPAKPRLGATRTGQLLEVSKFRNVWLQSNKELGHQEAGKKVRT